MMIIVKKNVFNFKNLIRFLCTLWLYISMYAHIKIMILIMVYRHLFFLFFFSKVKNQPKCFLNDTQLVKLK